MKDQFEFKKYDYRVLTWKYNNGLSTFVHWREYGWRGIKEGK